MSRVIDFSRAYLAKGKDNKIQQLYGSCNNNISNLDYCNVNLSNLDEMTRKFYPDLVLANTTFNTKTLPQTELDKLIPVAIKFDKENDYVTFGKYRLYSDFVNLYKGFKIENITQDDKLMIYGTLFDFTNVGIAREDVPYITEIYYPDRIVNVDNLDKNKKDFDELSYEFISDISTPWKNPDLIFNLTQLKIDRSYLNQLSITGITNSGGHVVEVKTTNLGSNLLTFVISSWLDRANLPTDLDQVILKVDRYTEHPVTVMNKEIMNWVKYGYVD